MLCRHSPALGGTREAPDGSQRRVATWSGPTEASTMLGVLTRGSLDNGRGKARLNMFRHKHEVSGQTPQWAPLSIGSSVSPPDGGGGDAARVRPARFLRPTRAERRPSRTKSWAFRPLAKFATTRNRIASHGPTSVRPRPRSFRGDPIRRTRRSLLS